MTRIVKNCKMYFLIFSILFVQGRASESGTYSILQHPKSLKFKGNEELHTNNLLNVHAASSGFSTQEENKKWSGLIIANPFNTPQIDVIIVADGVKRVKSIEMKDGVKSFPLEGDSVHESLNMLSTIAEENESQYIDIDLRRNFKDVETYADELKNILIPTIPKSATHYLKPDENLEDKSFLKQIAFLHALRDKLPLFNNSTHTFVTIRLSLKSVAKVHGENSPAFNEAVKLLSDALEKFLNAFKKAYSDTDNGLLTFIANEPDHNRSKRQAVKNEVDPSKLNIATHYSDDYPVIFNIILWFGVVMAFSLLAISYTIATMDPGRDSIIYRMTSTRMKKDN